MPYDGEGIYEHYKGGLYKVEGLAFPEWRKGFHDITDKNSHMVIYRPLSPGSMLDHDNTLDFWIRPLIEFNELVAIREVGFPMIDGDSLPTPKQLVPRFRKLSRGEVMKIRNDRTYEWMTFNLFNAGDDVEALHEDDDER